MGAVVLGEGEECNQDFGRAVDGVALQESRHYLVGDITDQAPSLLCRGDFLREVADC